MKPLHVVLIILGIILAITAGWFIEQRQPGTKTADLTVPDNIDYYLAEVDYRAFDEDGTPHFRMRTPYLEHYIREDRSQITEPDILYHSDDESWTLQSQQGWLQHQSEILQLERQVLLQRNDSADPLTLTTEFIELEPDSDIVRIPQALNLTTDELDLQADSALMNMDKKLHHFERVKAIYQREDKHADS